MYVLHSHSNRGTDERDFLLGDRLWAQNLHRLLINKNKSIVPVGWTTEVKELKVYSFLVIRCWSYVYVCLSVYYYLTIY